MSGSNSAVECDLAKVEVAGSNPVSRSNTFHSGQLAYVPGESPFFTISPATADAQNFPGGQVQFTATGTFSGSSKQIQLKNTTWCVGSSSGMCNGNIASAATIDGNGLAQCTGGLVAGGTVTILAGTGHSMGNPDGGAQLDVFGTAQLTCP